MLLVTGDGMSIRFAEDDVREMGRGAYGVRGIKLGKSDRVVDMVVVDDAATVLLVAEKGYGKRTNFSEFRRQSRGGKGVIAMRTGERNGRIVGAIAVRDGDEILLTTANGKTVRTAVDEISVIGRATQGVRVLKLDEGDRVASFARVIREEGGGEGRGPAPEGPGGGPSEGLAGEETGDAGPGGQGD